RERRELSAAELRVLRHRGAVCRGIHEGVALGTTGALCARVEVGAGDHVQELPRPIVDLDQTLEVVNVLTVRRVRRDRAGGWVHGETLGTETNETASFA